METMQALLGRRSIRKFQSTPVSHDQIMAILQAAMYSPSTGNQRPWQFLILNDRTILNSITQFHPYAQALKTAPVAILLCGDLSLEQHPDSWIQDCSAATHCILLAAHSLGLGSLWLGLYPQKEKMGKISEVCELPAHIAPFAVLPVGLPDEEKHASDRFSVERVHYNRW